MNEKVTCYKTTRKLNQNTTNRPSETREGLQKSLLRIRHSIKSMACELFISENLFLQRFPRFVLTKSYQLNNFYEINFPFKTNFSHLIINHGDSSWF